MEGWRHYKRRALPPFPCVVPVPLQENGKEERATTRGGVSGEGINPEELATIVAAVCNVMRRFIIPSPSFFKFFLAPSFVALSTVPSPGLYLEWGGAHLLLPRVRRCARSYFVVGRTRRGPFVKSSPHEEALPLIGRLLAATFFFFLSCVSVGFLIFLPCCCCPPASALGAEPWKPVVRATCLCACVRSWWGRAGWS